MATWLDRVGTTAVDILGTAANTAVRGVVDTALTIGRAGAHSAAPDELEYYLCSLELFTSDKVRAGFLAFSVMPSDIMESKTAIATITKTQYGVVDTFANGFVPRDISIRGTFGKRFRMVNVKKPDGQSQVNFFNNVGILDAAYRAWDDATALPAVHSGYGLTKILKRMVECSYELDATGKPHLLLFTNHALNTSYVVEIVQDSFSMSQDTNTIWQYSLEMKALAPATAVVIPWKFGFVAREGINAAASAAYDITKDINRQILRNIF